MRSIGGFSPGSLIREKFSTVTAGMVRDLDGDGVAAIVAARILYEVTYHGSLDGNGVRWWRATHDTLAEDTGLSRQQVQRAVQRLVEHGFVATTKQRLSDRGDWDQTLSYSLVEQHPSPTSHVHPSPPSHVHYSPPSNPPLAREVEEEQEHSATVVALFDTTNMSVAQEDKVRKSIDAEFEDWWKLYPRKVSKGQARTAWRTARKKAPLQQLTEAVARFAEAVKGKDQTYIAHAATWLNGERWLDAPDGRGRSRPAQGNDGYWENGGTFFPEGWGRG